MRQGRDGPELNFQNWFPRMHAWHALLRDLLPA